MKRTITYVLIAVMALVCFSMMAVRPACAASVNKGQNSSLISISAKSSLAGRGVVKLSKPLPRRSAAYEIIVPLDWSGTITALKPGFVFHATVSGPYFGMNHIGYSHVVSDHTEQNYFITN